MHLEQPGEHRHADARGRGQPHDVHHVVALLLGGRDDHALDVVLLDHGGQVVDGAQQLVETLVGATLRRHAADDRGAQPGDTRELALDEDQRGGVADDQQALGARHPDRQEARGRSTDDERAHEQPPQQQRVGAARELEGLHALDHQREDRRCRHEDRGLVERRLVQDELVPVVQPGHLREQHVEGKEHQRPDREGRSADGGHDEHRARAGDHVGGGQAHSGGHLAAPRRLGQRELLRLDVRGREPSHRPAGQARLSHREPMCTDLRCKPPVGAPGDRPRRPRLQPGGPPAPQLGGRRRVAPNL